MNSASDNITGLILGLCQANERRRYFVTTSLIGWAQAWNQPFIISYLQLYMKRASIEYIHPTY